jgi:hypothetical protein
MAMNNVQNYGVYNTIHQHKAREFIILQNKNFQKFAPNFKYIRINKGRLQRGTYNFT